MTAGWTEQVTKPEFLRGLDQLVLARRRHAGRDETCGGSNRRTFRASGLDWVGHRPYEAGDDLRYLDWHLLARLDRPYVRTFMPEPANRLDILIDRSRSMTLGRPPKSELACALAFVFGYVASAAGERVAATSFADRMLSSLPAGRGPAHRARLLSYLVEQPSGGATALGPCLEGFASRAPEIGRVLVISDLIDDRVEPGLLALRRRGFDVDVLRLRAACDEEPELRAGAIELIDVETGSRRRVSLDAQGRQRYRSQRRTELERTATFCRQARIAMANLGTGQDLSSIVFHDLRHSRMLD